MNTKKDDDIRPKKYSIFLRKYTKTNHDSDNHDKSVCETGKIKEYDA